MARKKRQEDLIDEGGLLLREVDEDLRKDRVVRFFQDHQKALMAGILGVALAFGGFYSYRAWQESSAQERGTKVASAFLSLDEGRRDEAKTLLQELAKGKDFYAFESAMALAKLDLEAGYHDAAIARYTMLANNEHYGQGFRDIARLALVNAAISAENDAIAKEAIIVLRQGSYRALVPELEVALSLAEGGDTKGVLETALAVVKSDKLEYNRLDILAQVLGVQLSEEKE